MISAELAALTDLAIEEALSAAGHADCPPGAVMDGQHGVVCSCGTILGQVVDLSPPTGSVVTELSRDAPPVHAMPPPPDQIELARASRVDAADPISAGVNVIDPSNVYTPAEVEEHMLDVIARLDRGMHFERLCIEEVYALEGKYNLEFARQLIAAANEPGASDVRDARAKLACADMYAVLQVARMKLTATKLAMHSLRSMLSGYQSVAKSVSATYGAANIANAPRAF